MLTIIRAVLAAAFALAGLLIPIAVLAAHGGASALITFLTLQGIGAMLAPMIPGD